MGDPTKETLKDLIRSLLPNDAEKVIVKEDEDVVDRCPFFSVHAAGHPYVAQGTTELEALVVFLLLLVRIGKV